MKISELSPELQELCHKRQREQGNDGTFKGNLQNGKSDNNFIWNITIEGDNFWNNIDQGKDVTDSPFYPKSDKVINNYSIF